MQIVYVKNIATLLFPVGLLLFMRYVSSKRHTRQVKRSYQRNSAKSTVDDI